MTCPDCDGYRRSDLEAAVPAGATLPKVDPSPST